MYCFHLLSIRFCSDSSSWSQLFSAPYAPGRGISSRTSSGGVSLPSLISTVQPGHISNAPLPWTGTSLHVSGRTNTSSISIKQVDLVLNAILYSRWSPLLNPPSLVSFSLCLRCTLCSRVDHECLDQEVTHRHWVPQAHSILVRLKGRQPLSRGCMVSIFLKSFGMDQVTFFFYIYIYTLSNIYILLCCSSAVILSSLWIHPSSSALQHPHRQSATPSTPRPQSRTGTSTCQSIATTHLLHNLLLQSPFIQKNPISFRCLC